MVFLFFRTAHLPHPYAILANKTHLLTYRFILDFDGGIQIAEMLFRTNIIGFVGTGHNTSYPSNRLILWDDI